MHLDIAGWRKYAYFPRGDIRGQDFVGGIYHRTIRVQRATRAPNASLVMDAPSPATRLRPKVARAFALQICLKTCGELCLTANTLAEGQWMRLLSSGTA
jgi:hypothetical protein